jgi:carbon storage regulator CsrA
MLVLRRSTNEEVIIRSREGDIVIKVLDNSGRQSVRLGIDAPQSILVLRRELDTPATPDQQPAAA